MASTNIWASKRKWLLNKFPALLKLWKISRSSQNIHIEEPNCFLYALAIWWLFTDIKRTYVNETIIAATVALEACRLQQAQAHDSHIAHAHHHRKFVVHIICVYGVALKIIYTKHSYKFQVNNLFEYKDESAHDNLFYYYYYMDAWVSVLLNMRQILVDQRL